MKGKPRPFITVRFVCREDKELVFDRRNLFKESGRSEGVHNTLDFPAAVQEEKTILITF